MKTTLTCKVESELGDTIKKEVVEKGFKNLNGYLNSIFENRNNNSGSSDNSEALKKLKEKCLALNEELSTLQKINEELKNNNSNVVAEHYIKRAYEIAKITKAQLEKGLPK